MRWAGSTGSLDVTDGNGALPWRVVLDPDPVPRYTGTAGMSSICEALLQGAHANYGTQV